MKNPTRAPAPRQRTVRREIRALVDMPWVRRIVQCGRAGLLAFVLSAAASGNTPLPLALGFLVGLDADWTVLAAAGGSCAGYLLFWGPEACLEPMAGIVAGLLAAALFAGTELRRRAWFLPALCGAMTAVLGLVFLLARGMVDSSGFVGFLLRVGCAAGSAAVFRQVRTQRDAGRCLRRRDAGLGPVPGGLVPGFGSGPGVCGFSRLHGDGDGGAAHGGTVRVGGGPVPDYLCAGDAGVVRRLFVWLPSGQAKPDSAFPVPGTVVTACHVCGRDL